jgi:hypothetical protein
LFTLTPQRLIIITLALAYLLLSRQRQAKKSGLELFIALNILWCMVSTGASIEPIASLKKLLGQVFEYYVIYFIYVRSISSIQTIRKVLTALVIAMSICSVFGAIEAYRGWSVMQLFPPVQHTFGIIGAGVYIDAERGVRVLSTFDHAILFGAALVMGITMTFYLLAVERNRTKRLFWWLATILMVLNMYKTVSRGPWLAAGVGLVLMFVFGSRKLRKPLLVVAVLVVAVLVSWSGVRDSIVGIYRNTFDSNTYEGSSYAYRYGLTNAAMGTLGKNVFRALWGYGPDSFSLLHLKGDLGGQPHEFLSCDSTWIGTMVDTGYVGFVLFTLLLGKPLAVGLRNYLRAPPVKRDLLLVLVVNLAMYYFMMTSVMMYSWGQNGYMLWLVIAAVMAQGGLKETSGARPRVSGATSACAPRRSLSAMARNLRDASL